MSTAATVTEQSLRPEVANYGVYQETATRKDAKGNDVSLTLLRATTNEKTIQSAKDDGSLVFEQALSYDKVSSVQGIMDIGIAADEKVNIFNRGIVVKLTSKAIARLTEQDAEGNAVFQPIEGTFDMREDVAEATKRRNLSNTERALNFLDGLDENTKAFLRAQLMGQVSDAADEQ